MAASTDIETVSGSKKFDIWELIKRANTTDPYILMAKHRMNKSVTRRSRTGGRVVGRRRRRTSTTADSFGNESRMSHTDTEIDEEEDFDYDAAQMLALVNKESQPEEEVHHDTNLEHCQEMYARACRQYGVHPVACFNEALKKDKCILRHRQMTPNEIKALAVALVVNSSVETLDLGDNDIGQKGAEYIADMLRENNFIKHINLEDNNLGAAGVKHMVDLVKQLDSITSLNIAGNGLRECDSEVIRPLIEDTLNLKHLSVAHNQLRMVGGEVIGEALVWNDTMETLDLSWNNLRRDGAVLVAEGLAENTCLKKLNLAWNGFYLDGCRALSRALEDNKTLIELDLTCNRISKECLEKLLGGLKKNSTLEILRLGWNPLTPAGAMIMLEFIRDTKTSAIKELDLTDQLVEPAFVALLGEMEMKKEIKVAFGQVLGTDKRGDDDDEKQLMDENPIIVLMEFGKLMGFRLMDLFSALDKDGSKSLDHQEIRSGLRMVNIPLSDKCIEILINKLDVDGDGEIDFGELMAAQTEHRKKMSKFYAAQESDIDIEDTDIGRVRIKLSRLMAKKMSGNPAFKRKMTSLLEQMGILEADQ
ncbi:leucine-rich repeat-containing protein 74B-like isoform X2 [Mya arenaria]|uniref:leucine-rich repeat-containing protein 74B-like isoform X2 n=1 Tax=Mya arenaria TaxID=6604 RepID=UPI0022E2D12D|nr:leucine-rich repeat-containing protein 74B-like isoform X2 [Mya arenaria]